MATVCPYCNMEVRESAIEAEDGCCPECGAQITAASSFFNSLIVLLAFFFAFGIV